MGCYSSQTGIVRPESKEKTRRRQLALEMVCGATKQIRKSAAKALMTNHTSSMLAVDNSEVT